MPPFVPCGQFLRVEEVWQRMRLAHVVPDLATWQLRIKALARERLIEGRVSALLASMQKDGVAPDEGTLRYSAKHLYRSSPGPTQLSLVSPMGRCEAAHNHSQRALTSSEPTGLQ